VTTFAEGKVESLIYAETEDYKVIFAVLSEGDLYRSEDGGKIFTKVVGIPKIDELFKSPDSKKFYIIDETGVFWVSTDTGKTFNRRDSTKKFAHPVVHPTNADWILAGSPPCRSFFFCSTTLYVSKDFAQTWTEVKKFATEPWSWGDAGKYGIPVETVHMMYADSEGSMAYTYGQSKNLGKTIDYTIPNAIALLASDQYFFVAQSTGGKLTLYAGATNATQLKPCLFPESMEQKRYSILDTSTGSTFINVEHGGSGDRAWGHTYVANSFTNPSFSLSLQYNRRQGGKVDFARVKGVNGVYIANQWSASNGTTGEIPRETPLQTYISFNNGGKWTRLTKPTNVPCSDCTGLNLVGRSNRRNIPSFYTTSKAVGLIIASGNVLNTLRDTTPNDLDTYFSRDAGLTWEKVRSGAHHYQFLDHGGIIALVDFVNPTSKYTFTFNEGIKWYDCSISGLEQKPVQVTSLSYPPMATHLSFHMIGERSDGGAKGVVITVDFSELHNTVCDPVKDYETFSPHDNNKCLLGLKSAYKRRKRDSECFNNNQIENNTASERCPCSADDWECDVCYQESGDGKCVKIKSPQCDAIPESTPPADCQKQYPVRDGYRLVGFTMCDPFGKGAVNRFHMQDCPGSHGSSSGTKIGVTVAILVVIVALIGFIVYRRRTNESFREKTDEYWERFTGLFRSGDRAAGYSSVGGRGGEPQDLDDDEGLLSADSDYKKGNNMGNGERDDFI